MKKILKQFAGLVIVLFVVFGAMSQNVNAQEPWEEEAALHKYPYGFDFVGGTAYTVNAGDTKEVVMWSKLNYTYFVGPHTSSSTYIECSGKRNTETIKIHIGADEAQPTVCFYLYPDEDGYRSGDAYVCLEVYVKNRSSVYKSSEAEALKSYAGNNSEFNAYYYYVNYSDLRAAFGANGDALLNHWNTFGKSEKRVANRFK